MKKEIKKISIVLILLVSMLVLVGCSEEETQINSYYEPYEQIEIQNQKTNLEQLKQNIVIQSGGITKSGDYIIKVMNNNSEAVFVDELEARFFDNAGNFIKSETAEDYYFCVPAKSEIITYIYGYDEDFAKYSKSEFEVYIDEPLYTYYYENLEVKSQDNGEEMAITITNNNNATLDTIEINVVFMQNGEIVGIEEEMSYDKEIAANGGKAYLNVDYPIDAEYEEVAFDEVKVYIVSAYNDQYN